MTTPAMQDYLKAIHRLQEEGTPPSTKGVADALGVTPASATNMIKRLAELELATHEPYQGVQLTDRGELIALEVIRHHRLIELFLVETLGLSWDEVHKEAEVLEHHISEELEARIAEFLGHPERDPHGDPIPAMDGRVAKSDEQSLIELTDGVQGELVRVANQDPDVLRFLGAHGLYPGARLVVERIDPAAGVVFVRVEGKEVHLGMELASGVYIKEGAQ